MVRSDLSTELLQTPARTTHADRSWWEKALVAAFTALILILILAPAVLADTEAGNLPPPPTRAATMVDRVLSNQEIQLAMIVLGFGVLMMLCLVLVIIRLDFSEDATIRILTLSLLIVATLFIIAAGFSKEDIAPVIGLFGTIVGYLLGRQTYRRPDGNEDRREPK